MGMDTIGAASSFLSDWSDARAYVKQQEMQRTKASRERAMETFAEAMRECDKAVDGIMEKHQENVAKANERIKEFRRKQAAVEQRAKHAEEQRLFYEEALIRSINIRNMRIEDMKDDEERREDLDLVG